jgi:hypothetical protein
MELDIFTIGWLAGLLEGEGSFLKGAPSSPNGIKVSIQMTDEDIIKKVADIFNLKYWTSKDNRNPAWKRLYVLNIKGKTAFELMKLLKPYMGQRRQGQIQRAMDSYDPLYKAKSQRKYSDDQVREVRKLYSNGKSIKEIIPMVKMSQRTAYRIIFENGYNDVV